MRPVLTQRQNETLEYIRAHLRQHDRPPTLEEIGMALGIRSPTGIRKHLMALEKKGYLEREAHAARGIRLVDTDPSSDLGAVTLPVTGSNPAAYLRVDPFFLLKSRHQEQCLLGVCTDDGMNTVGIRKGDFLVIEKCPRHQLRNMETVAVRVQMELRARTFVRQSNMAKLQPSDTRYATTPFILGETFILGRVIAVMRRL